MDKEWMEFVEADNEAHAHLLKPQKVRREEGDEAIEATFTSTMLKAEIKKLKSKSAPGEDGITNEVIKNLPEKLVNILLRTFKLCADMGYFPAPWRASMASAPFASSRQLAASVASPSTI